MAIQETARTQYIEAKSGVNFAYRRLGRSDGIPLGMHMHYRGNMDFWDPALINPLAAVRHVIIFDQAGIGRSNGSIATSYQGWADDLIALVTALGINRIDLFGFSMGGCAVQMVALTAPRLVRKLVIAGSTPSAPSEFSDISGIVWPRDKPPTEPFKLLSTAVNRTEIERVIALSFFYDTPKGREAFQAYWQRRSRRDVAGEPLIGLLDPKLAKTQSMAYADWAQPNGKHSYDRLGELRMPVLVMNGDYDLLIPTSRSLELLKRIKDVRMSIYPEAGHGFIWQYAERIAAEVDTFLDSGGQQGGEVKL